MELRISKPLAVLVVLLCVISWALKSPVQESLMRFIFENENYRESHWLAFVFSALKISDYVVVGLWLGISAGEFGEDGATWLAMGFVFGVFAVVLFILVLIYHRRYGIRFHVSFSNLFIMLALCWGASLMIPVARIYFPKIYTSTVYMPGMPRELYAILFFAGSWIVLSTLLAIFMWQLIKDKAKALIWFVVTIILGATPVIVKLAIMIYQRKRAMAGTEVQHH